MNIDVVEHEGMLILRVEGEIDIATSSLLDEELERAESSDAAKIVVDLDHVGFIDSTGLHVLLRYVSRSSDDGRRLRFTKGSVQAQRLFEITGVVDMLPFLEP